MGTAWRDGGGGDAAATAAHTAAGNAGKRPGWQLFIEVDVDMATHKFLWKQLFQKILLFI